MPMRLDLLRHSFPHLATFFYLAELHQALEGCDPIVDIGCGGSSPIRFLRANKIGIDAYLPALEAARKSDTHKHYLLAEAAKIGQLLRVKSVDAVVALDLIEHLDEKEGTQFLAAAEDIARRRVVIFTPNGFLPQSAQGGDLQEHRSGWTCENFSSRGYRVVGIGGPKRLRAEYHEIAMRPKVVGSLISSLGHLVFSRNHAESAAGLLAVKHLDG